MINVKNTMNFCNPVLILKITYIMKQIQIKHENILAVKKLFVFRRDIVHPNITYSINKRE